MRRRPEHTGTVDDRVRHLLQSPPAGGLSKMWSVLRLDLPRTVLGASAVSAASVLTVVQPTIVRRLLTHLSRADLTAVAGNVATLVVLAVVVSWLRAGAQVSLGRTANRTVQRLRRVCSDSLVAIPASELPRNSTADLVSRCSTDAELVGDVVVQGPVQMAGSTLVIGGALVGMVQVDTTLSVAAFVVCCLSFGTVILFSRRLTRLSRARQQAVGRYVAEVHRSLAAILTLRAFGAADFATGRIRRSDDELRTASDASVRARALIGPIVELTVQFGTVALLCVGAWRATTGHLASASLVTFVLYVVMLVAPVGALSGGLSLARTSLGALDRLTELVAICTPQARAGIARVTEPDRYRLDWASHPNDVEFDRVGYTYGTGSRPAHALTDVSFSVPAGSWVSLVGPSGSGKSTVLALLERFVEPTTGVVRVGGTDVTQLDLDTYRRGLGYVEQSCPLFSGTVLDNLRLGRDEVTEDACWAVLRDVGLVDTVRDRGGLYCPVGESSYVFSGGERQRLAVARVLLLTPRLLLLDEVTSGLDALNQAQVVRLIRERTTGVTTLSAGHRMSTVTDSDLVVLLDQGRVVDVEEHRVLRRSSSLYRSLLAG